MNKTIKKLTIICTILFCIKSFSQRKYTVKAKSGLIIREQPTTKSNRLEKLPYNYQFQVDEKSVNRKDTIVENGYKIAGNWVPVENGTTKGFVFDGFMERTHNINRYKLYGKVKSFKEFSYFTQNNRFNTSGNREIKHYDYIKFNSFGSKTHIYDYNKGWELDTKYDYNAKNQLISRKFLRTKALAKYKYDKKGNTIERFDFDDNEPECKFIYGYDSRGNEIYYEYYSFEKNASEKAFYNYNTANKLIDATYYNYDKSIGTKYINTYKNDTILIEKYVIDSKNNKRQTGKRTVKDSLNYKIDMYIEYFEKEDRADDIYLSTKKIFNQNNELIKLETYESEESQDTSIDMHGGWNQRTIKEYKSGELISVKKYIEDYTIKKEVLVEEVIYKHNYKNLLEYVKHYPGWATIRKEYFYDYNNNLIKIIEYEQDNLEKVQTTKGFRYIFDNNGNWIEKQVFRDGSLYEVYKRILEYY